MSFVFFRSPCVNIWIIGKSYFAVDGNNEGEGYTRAIIGHWFVILLLFGPSLMDGFRMNISKFLLC